MRTRLLSRTLAACVALSLCSGLADHAAAQGKARPKAAKVAAFDPQPIEAQLKSRDASQMRDALEAARQAGTRAAALSGVIQQLLRDGLPLDLTSQAIGALGALGAESSSKVLAAYAQHRDPKVRRDAARALMRTRGPEAVKALRRCLSDGDPGVRASGATGLGNLGARQFVPDLFLALERKNAEAGGAIGQLCNAEQCEQLLGKLGRISFDILSPGFDQILFRADLSEELKIKVVGRVREMGTGEANRLLKEVQGRWPAQGSKKLKQAIDQAVLATEGGAGATSEGSSS
jgi:hypothetical protein